MDTAAGIFLVAHGLIHIAIWLMPPADDPPFDPRHSWLLDDASWAARALAFAASGLFVTAGVLLLMGSDAGVVAVLGSLVSSLLVTLTFNRWLVGALAINAAILVIALA